MINYRQAESHVLDLLRQQLSPALTYHGVHHTVDVLNSAMLIADKEKVADQDLVLLRTAVLLHDAGFIYLYKGHEEKGCEMSKELLPAYGFDGTQIEVICGMIRATRVPQQPKTQLERVIELDPKMMRAYDTLGLCYDYLGKFDQAIKNYNRAVELNRVQAKPSPWPHVDRAISLVAVNQLGEAEKNLREALRYDGELPQAHYQLGRVLEMEGDHQAAVQSLKQAATLNSSYPEPHYLLGRIYQRMGKSQLAKAEIERFQQLEKPSQPPGPNHAPAPKN